MRRVQDSQKTVKVQDCQNASIKTWIRAAKLNSKTPVRSEDMEKIQTEFHEVKYFHEMESISSINVHKIKFSMKLSSIHFFIEMNYLWISINLPKKSSGSLKEILLFRTVST